jgi:hypothetical protein
VSGARSDSSEHSQTVVAVPIRLNRGRGDDPHLCPRCVCLRDRSSVHCYFFSSSLSLFCVQWKEHSVLVHTKTSSIFSSLSAKKHASSLPHSGQRTAFVRFNAGSNVVSREMFRFALRGDERRGERDVAQSHHQHRRPGQRKAVQSRARCYSRDIVLLPPPHACVVVCSRT